jgi:hypothetical protein
MIDARLLVFRAEEAAARSALEAGCRSDLAQSGSFIALPLRKARLELEGYLESLGTIQPRLAVSLGTQRAEAVARDCANSVFANASVRFRARFRTYAEVLVDAERRFVEAAMPGGVEQGRPTRTARQIPVPRIDVYEERSILPQSRLSLPESGPWVLELENCLQRTLESNVNAARRRLLDRGERQMLRTLGVVRLIDRRYGRKDLSHSSSEAERRAQP